MVLAVITALLLGSVPAYAYIFGVDVSTFQGTINWDVLKASTSFAVMRASYGADGTDAQLSRNRSEARRVGILRGFYHFAYPQYYSSLSEANWFVSQVGAVQPGEKLVLDYEQSLGNQVQWCKDWLDRVYALTGVKPLIYLNLSTVNAYDWSSVKNAGYGLWLAYWDGNGDPSTPGTQWGFTTIKQYSDSGSVGGISPVDVDSFNGDASQWGGADTSGPASVSWDANRIDVLGRGTDGMAHLKTWTTAGGWAGWSGLTGTGIAYAPAICSWGNGRLDAFMTGTNGHIYWWNYNGGTWAGGGDLGGATSFGPAACSWGNGRIDAFYTGTDSKIYQKTYSGGAWGSWGVPISYVSTNKAPACSSWGANRIDLYPVGTANDLYHFWYNGSTWTGEAITGPTTDLSVGACSWGTNRLDIVVTGTSRDMYHYWKTTGSWTGEALGTAGVNAASAACISTRGSGTLDVFYRGTNSHLYQKSYNGTWGSWVDRGNYLDDSTSLPDIPNSGAVGAITVSSIVWNWGNVIGETGFRVYDAATGGNLKGSTGVDVLTLSEGSLTANTSYTRYACAYNANGETMRTLLPVAVTLSVPPTTSTITCDKPVNTPQTTQAFTFTAVGGFGAGTISSYKYAWDQSTTHTWTGSESTWNTGTNVCNANINGNWYLHVKGYNSASVANGTLDLGPYVFSGGAPNAPASAAVGAVTMTSIVWNWGNVTGEDGFRLYDAATGGNLKGSTGVDVLTLTEGTLVANTSYTRYICAYNAVGESARTTLPVTVTLSVPPTTSTVTCDKPTNTVQTTSTFTFTAVGGFGGGLVSSYRYVWDQSATHTWTGSEATWNSGTKACTATADGFWYMHVRGYNSASVANGTLDLGPYVYDGPDTAPSGDSSPASVSWDANRIDVFSRGGGSKLHQKTWTSAGGWGGWTEFFTTTSSYSPGASSWGNGRLDVFLTGSNGHVNWQNYSSGVWSGQTDLLGGTNFPAAACSWGSGRIDLFNVGTNMVLYQKTYANSAWGGSWTVPIPEIASNKAPACCSWGTNRIDLYVVGTGNGIYHYWYNGSTWTGESITGPTTDLGVGACSWGTNRLDIVVTGTSRDIYHYWKTTGSWSGEALGRAGAGVNSYGAACISTRGANTLDIFYRGVDNHLYQRSYNSSWGAWVDLGAYFD